MERLLQRASLLPGGPRVRVVVGAQQGELQTRRPHEARHGVLLVQAPEGRPHRGGVLFQPLRGQPQQLPRLRKGAHRHADVGRVLRRDLLVAGAACGSARRSIQFCHAALMQRLDPTHSTRSVAQRHRGAALSVVPWRRMAQVSIHHTDRRYGGWQYVSPRSLSLPWMAGVGSPVRSPACWSHLRWSRELLCEGEDCRSSVLERERETLHGAAGGWRASRHPIREKAAELFYQCYNCM
mmetsp:Transcript_17397/g.45208  ORF Transcript_17397/g.45208 Transcript_17397/m.45208 type:complete len:238 (+) Transcript_17397:489-1202(+)